MADYILTYDIPNEHRERLEEALTKLLKAKRELGVSTFWRFTSSISAVEIRNALKSYFPAVKLYVYEVNPLNAATTEVTRSELEAFLKRLRALKK